MVDKLGLPFPILSDPEGDALIKPLGVWNEERAIARPSTFVVGPDGVVTWADVGSHAGDRPIASDIAEALAGSERT